MLQVVDPSARSVSDAIDELRDVIALAYAQVKVARRTLASLPVAPELAAHLQMAEAELVRASVAANTLSVEDHRPPASAKPELTPVIPLDIEGRSGYEYGS
jgi:hypothetical protein